MEMGAGGVSAFSHAANPLSPVYALSALNEALAEVGVSGGQNGVMFDDYQVAIVPQDTGECDQAVRRGQYGRAHGYRDVQAFMRARLAGSGAAARAEFGGNP